MASAPSMPLRLLLAAVVVAVAIGALLTLVHATDAALSVMERLQRLPTWLAWIVATLVLGLLLATGWLLWRLLRPPRVARPLPRSIERPAIEARVAAIGEAAASSAREALRDLDQRRASGLLHIALFGTVSSGKSSLIRALLPDADTAVDVRAGTTRRVRLFHGSYGADSTLVLADVPGTEEWQDQGRAVGAREEALRAHLVLFTCEGDLSRSQFEEWEWLRSFDKPLLLVLNKSDRYDEAQLSALRERLQQRCGSPPVVVGAGGCEQILVRAADGREQVQERERPAHIEALHAALGPHIRRGAAALEAARERAVLLGLDLRLDAIESTQRAEQAERLVREYARKAALGAMAAVVPGSDLLIQGALASALLSRLCQLHGVSLRAIDLDDFLDLAGGRLRGSSALLLAIVGNALKAFPGLGTVGGGLVHAAAYAMLFHSLGQAVADSLARGRGFDREDALGRLQARLEDQPGLLRLAPDMLRLALDAREVSTGDDRQGAR